MQDGCRALVELSMVQALVDRNHAYAGKAALIHKAESDDRYAGPRIAEYSAAILAAGGEVSVVDYPNSVHAFFNDDRLDVYQADNAALAWQRSIDFLDSRLR